MGKRSIEPDHSNRTSELGHSVPSLISARLRGGSQRFTALSRLSCRSSPTSPFIPPSPRTARMKQPQTTSGCRYPPQHRELKFALRLHRPLQRSAQREFKLTTDKRSSFERTQAELFHAGQTKLLHRSLPRASVPLLLQSIPRVSLPSPNPLKQIGRTSFKEPTAAGTRRNVRSRSSRHGSAGSPFLAAPASFLP